MRARLAGLLGLACLVLLAAPATALVTTTEAFRYVQPVAIGPAVPELCVAGPAAEAPGLILGRECDRLVPPGATQLRAGGRDDVNGGRVPLILHWTSNAHSVIYAFCAGGSTVVPLPPGGTLIQVFIGTDGDLGGDCGQGAPTSGTLTLIWS